MTEQKTLKIRVKEQDNIYTIEITKELMPRFQTVLIKGAELEEVVYVQQCGQSGKKLLR